MRTPRSIGTVLGTLWVHVLLATHIIGGELYYDHLTGDQYQFTLKIYRDCGPGNTNGTGFDPDAELGVFDGAGNYLFSEFIPLPGTASVPVVLNNPCLTAPASICVEVAAYVTTIDLPPLAGGYVISYQRCCRTPTIMNLDNPSGQGLTCTVVVPDVNVFGYNSSPRFTNYPPIALCVNQDMVFDHSAVDPDGDVLEYGLVTPLNGGSSLNPQPTPPAGPPYAAVNWGVGFSQVMQMSANPPLALDPVTGELTVTPNTIGSFVVGLGVRDVRNGVVLSEVYRDLRFDVVPCQVLVLSSIQQQQVFCTGDTVQMVNLSTGASFYHWDFGVPNTLSDTSDLAAPQFIYPDTGSYEVTLVANPGWPCADTSYASFQIYPPLAPGFVRPPIQCVGGTPLTFSATGNFTSNAQVDWDLGAGAVPSIASGGTIQTVFTQPGWHPVHLQLADHGCTDDHLDSVEVHPVPIAYFSTDTAGCTPLTVRFDNMSTAWTPMTYLWDFGDGSTSMDSTPVHVYIAPGAYEVSLSASTDSGCVDTGVFDRDPAVRAWVPPDAGAYAQDDLISIFDPVVTVFDASQGAGQWQYVVDGTTYDTPSFTHVFQEAGIYTVTQVVTSGLGCHDTTELIIHVADHLFYAPNAFTPNGDGWNDVFLPEVLGARLYELSIFDRWGERIFHTEDPDQGWDGTDAQPGVYVYKAWLAEYSSVRKEFVGTVTLIR
ncbi:MAG: PKD domain-containing protein [Flavobacteriales bacterium]|nr:PKD domain-containing protein [Flavobacteriales bacterium]MCB9166121.1 PKD domain-containing protein [Flavobacteriales bacterium]